MGFLGRHWKGILTFAVATAAFFAITALTGGLGAAPMAAVLTGGVGSGVLGALVNDLLDRKKPGLDLLWSGLLSGAITLGTLGLARALTPYIAPALARILPSLSRTVSDVAAPIVEKVANEVADAADPVASLPTKAPLPKVDVALPRPAPAPLPTPEPGPAPATRGIIGALNGEPASAGSRIVEGSLPRDLTKPLDGLIHPEDSPLGGRGTFKETFRLKPPNGDYVMGLARDDVLGLTRTLPEQTEVIQREVSMLDELSQKGVPVEKVVAYGTYNGRAAFVKEAYTACTGDPSFETEGYRNLTERSLDELEALKASLNAQQIFIGDLQLAVRADGSIIVTDPLVVHEGSSLPPDLVESFPSAMADMSSRFDEVIEMAKKSLAEKALATH